MNSYQKAEGFVPKLTYPDQSNEDMINASNGILRVTTAHERGVFDGKGIGIYVSRGSNCLY